MSCVLAIDLGTGGPKVGLVTAAGHVLGVEFEPVPTSLLEGGGAEQRPGDWWAAITAAARRLLATRPELRDAVSAICTTAQWAGTVAIDRDREPLCRAIIWMDARGAP